MHGGACEGFPYAARAWNARPSSDKFHYGSRHGSRSRRQAFAGRRRHAARLPPVRKVVERPHFHTAARGNGFH
ncbi:protein of unknown function [Methylacidimicrobium sp. AP8]|nr:protein of unknown function [Methylacidimicrobium sp. AP8]